MSQNYYAEINLHLTWHTKDNWPMLRDDVETLVSRHLRKKAGESKGVVVHAIGGTEDHVHMAVTIPPTLRISDWIGQLKGSSSHEANQRLGLRGKVLEWQAGYGVVSFGTRDLQWVISYIESQKRHHASGKAVDRLERITEMEELPG